LPEAGRQHRSAPPRRRGLPAQGDLHPLARGFANMFISYMEYVQVRYNHDMRLQHDLQRPNEPKQLRPGEDVNRQIKPGEDVQVADNRIQINGQTAVMSINGLLTKVIFDHNPTNEFFVEESFPLDWMYPYLTPFGV